MQIVIDISEEKYDVIKSDLYNTFPSEMKEWGLEAIRKGPPLPKGHGRLIDYGYVVDAIDDWVNTEEYRYTNATEYLRKRVANTPTTIEADGGNVE